MSAVDDHVRALEVALRDFRTPAPVDLRLEAARCAGDDLVWIHKPGGSRTGWWVDPEAGAQERLVRAADVLQDQVFDQLPEAWGEARPPCPGHQHPAVPRLVDEQAWWVCPRSDELVGRIGALG